MALSWFAPSRCWRAPASRIRGCSRLSRAPNDVFADSSDPCAEGDGIGRRERDGKPDLCLRPGGHQCEVTDRHDRQNPECSFQLPKPNAGGGEDEQPDDNSEAAERILERSDEYLDQGAASQLDGLRNMAEQDARRQPRVALCKHRGREAERV